MKRIKHTDDLDIDFIKSKPMTEKEAKELSEFIKKLKEKSKGKSSGRRLAA